MKTHTNKKMIPKFVEVQSDEFETVITYETEDGKIFDDKTNAQRYESKLRIKRVEQKEFDGFSEVYTTWFKAKDEDELNFLRDYYAGGHKYVSGAEKIRVGEWFCVHVVYNGDRDDEYRFITFKDIKKEIQDFLDMFE